MFDHACPKDMWFQCAFSHILGFLEAQYEGQLSDFCGLYTVDNDILPKMYIFGLLGTNTDT